MDISYQSGNVSDAKKAARTLLATDFRVLLDSVRRITPIEVHTLLANVGTVEDLGIKFAYEVLSESAPHVDLSSVGPDYIPISDRYRGALAWLYEAHDLF